MQDRIFYAGCFGFAAGVLLRSFFEVDFYFNFLFGVISFALFLILLLLKNKWGIILFVFIFCISIGILRFEIRDSYLIKPVSSEEGVEGVLEGKLVDAPDIRESNQKLTLETELSGLVYKVLITTNFSQEFKYGDMIKVQGGMKVPENFITDQGKEFDYVNYLKKDGILYIMNYPEIEIISRGHGNTIRSALFAIKDKMLGAVNSSIYAPENLLMGGLILGERSPFSQELREDFITTGTIHIVALSGYNITIVAEWFMKFFGLFLSQITAIWMGILSILLFVLMTGASSTAVRAGVMATLALVARATGRNYDVARALVLAGVIMLLFNPYLLVYDVSFQLSFIATIAIIFLTPKVEKYFTWVTASFKLRETITLTFAAYIFVLPFILYKMGNLSLVALPANILILPFIPFTMGLGFLTSLLGAIWGPLGVPAGLIAYVFLHYELWVIEIFSKIPFASLAIPSFPLVLTLLIYALFIYKLFGRNIKKFFTEPS